MYGAEYYVVFQKILADPDDVSWRPVWATGRVEAAEAFAETLRGVEGRPTAVSKAQSLGKPQFFSNASRPGEG